LTVIVHEGISIFMISSRVKFYNNKTPDTVCGEILILFLSISYYITVLHVKIALCVAV